MKLMWRRYPLVVYLRGSVPFLWLGLVSRFAAAKFVTGEPVVARYLKALEPLLGEVKERRTSLHIKDDAARFAQELRAARREVAGSPEGDGPVPMVVIHAAACAAARVWPAPRFAALADELARSCGARVHFLGGPGDRAGLERILRLAEEEHACHTTLKLPQVAAVIAEADLFIGNDSGLGHIAAAVGTPLVVLWGGANLNMSRPEAAAGSCIVIYHDVPCRASCPETHCINPSPLECLDRIQADEVLDAARRLLRIYPRPLPMVSVGAEVSDQFLV